MKALVHTLCVALVLAGMACSRRDPRWALYKHKASFRPLKDSDFHGELPIFRDKDPKTLIGTVLDGADRYVDPKTRAEFRAIRVFTVVNGERVDRWYRRDKLVGHVFVLDDDPHFNQGGYWIEERDKAVTPLPSEIPAE